MTRLLLVEDEETLAKGLVFNLEAEGYEVVHCTRAEEALECFDACDMMILDLMLPGMDGLEMLTRVREADYQYPVLILSARSTEEHMLEGLSAGADDYMTKPFSLPELFLRIRRMLERQQWYVAESHRVSSYSFGEFNIHFETFEADTAKGRVRLTPHECYMMKYLIHNRDRTVSREELLEKVWGYTVTPETRTVDTFIARLRKLFEEDRKMPVHIQSVRGVGYRFFD